MSDEFRERCFLHFLRLCDRGRRAGASSGERQAFALAKVAIDQVPGLDSDALVGLAEFIALAAQDTHTAREVLSPRRRVAS